MELWIRSQSKDSLIKAYDLQIDSRTYKNRVFIINSRTSTDCVFLGEYKTKERALEVLDEIQEAMMLNEDYDYSGRAEVNTIRKCLIYQMPKE